MNAGLGYSLIGFEKSIATETTFQAINPKLNQVIPTVFFQASEQEVVRATEKAWTAFQDTFPLSVELRVKLLTRIAQKVKTNHDALVHWFCLETGLSIDRANAELKRTCFQFENYASGISNGYALETKYHGANPARVPKPQPELIKSNIPLGPVVVFGASNFPFAYSTLGGDVASAFAAGCPVIVKAHPMHPHTSSLSANLIAEAVNELNFPDGFFSHLLAIDYQVGQQLTLSEQVKAIGFTGSIEGGMALMKLIQQRKEPIPLYAEMGSSNPIVITPKALKESMQQIVSQIADAVLTDAGQFCTSPGLLFIQRDEQFEDLMLAFEDRFKQEAPICMLHPGIVNRYQSRKLEHEKWVKMRFDGKISGNFIQASLAQATVSHFVQNSSIQDEIFGSYLTVVTYSDEQELCQCINSLKGQLTASIYHAEEEDVARITQLFALKAGRIIFNGVPTGVEVSLAQQHGGPFPSSSSAYFSAVGWDAIKRFSRPVTLQNGAKTTSTILPTASGGKFFTNIND
jgi:NADP-dependent aldehyde dehydrogenase